MPSQLMESFRRLLEEDRRALLDELEIRLRPHAVVRGESAPFLTVKDLQQELGYSEPSILKLCSDPTFPAFKIGTEWRVSRSDFEIWIESKKKEKERPQSHSHVCR